MAKPIICPGKAEGIWGETLDWFSYESGILSSTATPTVPVKRLRMKCELCGRKVLSDITVTHDGGVIHRIPPHKVKHWWKKKKKRKEKRHRRR